MPRILAFSGSARRESLNKKLLHAAVAAVRELGGAEVTVLDFRERPIPLYDGDLEDAEGMPENAQKFVDAINAHHALLIASPEYNSQITPLLKNAIDWATRAEKNPISGKVAAVMSASPGNFGGIRSMTLARQLLTHLGAHVLPVQCILPQADKAFDAEGKLTNEKTQESVRKLATALVETTRKLHTQ